MNSTLKRIMRQSDLIAAGAVVLVVAMMIIPLPSVLLDFFITLNIAGALMIVCATLYVPKALDFSSFPSLLLLTTGFIIFGVLRKPARAAAATTHPD